MNMRFTEPGRGTGPVHMMLRGIVWIGRFAAWIILPMLILVLIGVVLSAGKVGTILSWENDVFLLGSKLTIASIGDLQWHLFGAMLMLSIAGTLVEDKHVRVDLFRQRMSERGKALVDFLGHLIFLLPFASILVWHGFDFAMRSFNMGEGSNYDGLYDRFMLKSIVPIGFSLLAVAGLGLVIVCFRKVFKKKRDGS